MRCVLLYGEPEEQCRGAMIDVMAIAGSQAPVRVVALVRQVIRHIAFVAVAATTITGRLSAAVVVGNDVIAVIGRVAARSYPGHGCHFRSRGTGGVAAAAAAAKESVNGTITPVAAFVWILGIVLVTGGGFACTRNRQKRDGRHADDRRSQPGKKTSPGGRTRQYPGSRFHPFIYGFHCGYLFRPVFLFAL